MKKTILIVLMALLAVSAFAAPNTFKSWNKDGQFNIYASVGWSLGFTGSVAFEFIITEFKIGPVPFDFGVAARGAIEAYPDYFYLGTTNVYWGAAPMATLHMGLGVIPLEFFISAGVAFYGWASGYTPYGYYGFNVGFASVEGVMWHLSPTFALIIDFGYLGYVGIWGFGVEIQF